MRKFFTYLKEFAWPFGLVGGIYTYGIRLVPDFAISFWLAAAVFALCVSIIITLSWHLAQKEMKPQSTVRVDRVLDLGASMLTEPTEHLGFDMGAKIYHKDGDHYLLVGEGMVVNVQPDRRCLLRVSYEDSIGEDMKSQISQNIDIVRGRLVLRPGIVMKASVSNA